MSKPPPPPSYYQNRRQEQGRRYQTPGNVPHAAPPLPYFPPPPAQAYPWDYRAPPSYPGYGYGAPPHHYQAPQAAPSHLFGPPHQDHYYGPPHEITPAMRERMERNRQKALAKKAASSSTAAAVASTAAFACPGALTSPINSHTFSPEDLAAFEVIAQEDSAPSLEAFIASENCSPEVMNPYKKEEIPSNDDDRNPAALPTPKMLHKTDSADGVEGSISSVLDIPDVGQLELCRKVSSEDEDIPAGVFMHQGMPYSKGNKLKSGEQELRCCNKKLHKCNGKIYQDLKTGAVRSKNEHDPRCYIKAGLNVPGTETVQDGRVPDERQAMYEWMDRQARSGDRNLVGSEVASECIRLFDARHNGGDFTAPKHGQLKSRFYRTRDEHRGGNALAQQEHQFMDNDDARMRFNSAFIEPARGKGKGKKQRVVGFSTTKLMMLMRANQVSMRVYFYVTSFTFYIRLNHSCTLNFTNISGASAS